MRDLAILSVVGLGVLIALRRPWVGVLLWTWVSIMNPHRYAWGLAYSAPIAAAAAGATLLGLIFTRDRQNPFQGTAVWWLFGFAMWITLSWRLGVDPAGDYPAWDRVMKIYLMTFVALALLQTRQQLLTFAWFTAGSIGLLATKGGIFTVLTAGAYRVWGPPGSFIEDNNDMALATILTVPILYFLYLQIPNKWLRWGMLIAIVLCVASALGSQSRGGFLALGAMSSLLWLRSSHKVVSGIAIIAIGATLLSMMPPEWWERMNTIRTYSEDASAMGRINAWQVAWETALHYPFGAGMSYQHAFLFDQFGQHENTVRAAHSIYFQVLGNHGFVGLALYLGLWISAYRAAGWLRANAKGIPEAKWAYDLGTLAQVSFVGFAVGGAFLSQAYFDLPYNMMILVVLAKQWVLKRGWETESAVATWPRWLDRAFPLVAAKTAGGARTRTAVASRMAR